MIVGALVVVVGALVVVVGALVVVVAASFEFVVVTNATIRQDIFDLPVILALNFNDREEISGISIFETLPQNFFPFTVKYVFLQLSNAFFPILHLSDNVRPFSDSKCHPQRWRRNLPFGVETGLILCVLFPIICGLLGELAEHLGSAGTFVFFAGRFFFFFRRMENSFPATPMSDSPLRLEGSSISDPSKRYADAVG